MQQSALNALQQAAEVYIVSLFEGLYFLLFYDIQVELIISRCQLMRSPRQTRYNLDKEYAVGKKDLWRPKEPLT